MEVAGGGVRGRGKKRLEEAKSVLSCSVPPPPRSCEEAKKRRSEEAAMRTRRNIANHHD